MRKIIFGTLLLVMASAPAAAQAAAASSGGGQDVLNECRRGRACDRFHQLWLAGDERVHSATWLCFPQTFNGEPADRDRIYFLRKSDKDFQFGIVDGGRSTYDHTGGVVTSGTTGLWRWKSDPTVREALDDTLQVFMREGRDLNLQCRYRNSQHQQVRFFLSVQLLQGTYAADYKVEGQRVEETGRCLALPAPSN